MVQILDQKRDLSGMTTTRQSPPVHRILPEFWRHFGNERGLEPLRGRRVLDPATLLRSVEL